MITEFFSESRCSILLLERVTMKFNTLAKLIMFAFATFSVVTTFQNCSQSKNSSLTNMDHNKGGSVNNNDSAKLAEVDLSNATAIEVQLTSLFSTNFKNDIPSIQINLSNGEMRYINKEGQYISPLRLCLYREELQEIKSIIETSKICQPEGKVSADTVCTMEYIYPYAKIFLESNDIIKLGEKSGCSGIVDLCEDSKKALNGYISYLSSHLDNRKCL